MVQHFNFLFDRSYRLAGLPFGITRRRAGVVLDGDQFTVRFGPWRVSTSVENISETQVTGPFSFSKTAGPARLSLSDRGLTFATTSRRALCLSLIRPVAGIDPFGLIRHPGLTVTVADPEALAHAINEARQATDLRRAATGEARHHNTLIVGGGNAGISLAARLRRDGNSDVALIDPVDVHRYRPLLSYVGGGQARMSDLEKPQASVIPDGVRWYQDRVIKIDPVARVVHTEKGARLTATDVVICPGVEQDWEKIPGSRTAVHSAHGASNYVDQRATHTWELIRNLRSGTAVFAIADGPVPCAGAGLKPLYLAADHWHRSGVLGAIDVVAIIGWETIFGIDSVDAELSRAAAEFGIRVVTGAQVREVDSDARNITVTTTHEEFTLHYDLLHLVPPHRAPPWIAASDLAGPDTDGMIEISPETLAHRRHPGIWGLGDAGDVQASRSGGALRKQVPVVADNIAHSHAGEPLSTYDGYSTAPITVARDRLVLAEFNRSLHLTPSFPVINLVKARRLTWLYDRYLQPAIYWHSILKGRVNSQTRAQALLARLKA